jgi:exonuclease III
MSVDFEKSDQDFARTLYRWHGILSQPTYRVLEYVKRWGNPLTPHVFDNYSTKPRELAYRSFGPAALLGAAAYLLMKGSLLKAGLLTAGFVLAIEIGRLALHCLAFSQQKKNYIHIRGKAPEVESANPKIMSWNILGLSAGMNYTCGGCIPFRKRFSEIVARIKEEKPDIIVLQECFMDASVTENIVEALKDDYAHFFAHNGPNRWGIESGLLIITKSPVESYTFTPFQTDNWTIVRGFATLKMKAYADRPDFAVIGTHMEAGYAAEDAIKRQQQLAQIHAHAKDLTDVKTVILAGDTNTDAARDPERKELEQVLVQFYDKEEEETCTNALDRIRHPNSKNSSSRVDRSNRSGQARPSPRSYLERLQSHPSL